MTHQEFAQNSNAVLQQQQQQQVLCPPESTLWMGDLKQEWDANFIREAFGENAGDVTNVKMRSTYCFVEFRDGPTARAAMLRVNGMTLPNDPSGTSRFNLAFANSPHHMSIEYNLFVNNLSPDVDDVALFRLFGERYMSCRGAKVYRHEDGASKEQGFVRFTSETDQQKALVELNKHKFHGRELFLKLARPKTRGGPAEKRFGGQSGPPNMMGPAGYGAAAGGFVAPVQAMPMLGAMPYGMVSTGAPLAISGPYGTQMAPNHGVAGFGRGMPTGQQFIGQPLVLGYPQNAGFMQPTAVHPTGHMMAPIGGPFSSVAGVVGPPQMKQPPPSQNIMANMPPPQPLYEDVEPLFAEEHNAILYNSSAEFHTALEASRWNAVGFLPDTKRKELYNMLHG
uniref:RRM domain-containing protein n=1 Tax=Globodera pallida TaxID=36090 RepID=A0A183BZG2_GLOPA